jgi:UDP-N-acetylmuramate dehydrogenase
VEIDQRDDHAIVTANAGVGWDDFAAEMTTAGFVGVECLGGIPGLVGATPMQNVGAYGQEVADTITHVRVLDRSTGAIEEITATQCQFAYRSSVFRGRDRWIILAVTFRFARGTHSAPIKYAELSKALGVPDGGTAPLQAVRDTVITLRRGKGMVVDPADPDSRSAGSFFTNPIVDAATVAQIRARLPPDTKVPAFPAADGMTKLAAAWLIERAGFTKGTTRGPVGTSTKHSLALINRGGGTTSQLLSLADEIRAGVLDKLGVTLEQEPIVVGV